MSLVAQPWCGGRVLRFGYAGSIGSSRAHPRVFQVHLLEISPLELAPYVIVFKLSHFHKVLTLRLDQTAHARLRDERYAVDTPSTSPGARTS